MQYENTEPTAAFRERTVLRRVALNTFQRRKPSLGNTIYFLLRSYLAKLKGLLLCLSDLLILLASLSTDHLVFLSALISASAIGDCSF